MTDTSNISKNSIITKYMDHVLEHGDAPKTVYQFAKDNHFEEKEFYQYYGNFEAVDRDIFVQLFENSLEILITSDEYLAYDAQTKLLSLYYTLFENFTANRSYINSILNKNARPLKNLEVLKDLRTRFKLYVKSLELQSMSLPSNKLNEIKNKSIQESAWIQFLVILKFWLNDSSANFQKTDIFIEKSLSASFELLNTAPFQKVVDLGKFLWKEKFSPSI